jgi:monovalent cation:proton antiporter-2 (CPA2) family protein
MNQLLVYLAAMVVVVPLSKRLGLGSVLGYLIAGALIGPQALDLLSDGSERTSQVAEFGVIMMLLLIGLELNPKLLWKMRGPIFGLGSLQVLVTATVFAAAAMVFGLPWQSATVVGLILCVSSTAIAMQTLQERGYAKSIAGDRAFSVLLFQDIAVIPILALFSLLASSLGVAYSNDETHPDWSPLLRTGLVFAAVVGVVLGGRFLLQPLFRLISRTKLRETFTALALLIVVGSAALMHFVGLSPALGAFLAGVVLADSEFRHQIEADIEPFKGLLLGLFFITVGAGVNFSLIAENPGRVLGLVFGIIVLKAAILYGIARSFRTPPPESLLFAASLAQGGEFAFVLIAQAGGLLSAETGQLVTAAIAISMALAPLLIGLTISHGMSRLDCVESEEREPDQVEESEKQNPVLVIGIGRFGQTLIRFLRANDIHATVLDIDSEQIDIIARFGIKSYFGDGANLHLLHSAGIANARALVIAIDVPETAIRIAEDVRRAYPDLPIFSRAYDRIHAYRLLHVGVKEIAIETSGSALALGAEVLRALGMPSSEVSRKADLFRRNNDRSIRELSQRFHEVDRETFIQATRQMSEQLEALLRSDPESLKRVDDRVEEIVADTHARLDR